MLGVQEQMMSVGRENHWICRPPECGGTVPRRAPRAFQEQVVFVLGRKHGPVKMEAGGEWDVDSVHVEDLVGAVHFGGEREAIAGGKCDGPFWWERLA